nr:protein kinase C and casein kinase substrate [Hymenolepis microstoma]
MQSNESDADNTTTASFWEPNQYIRTVKRVENGNKLCTELIAMVQERSDIEKAYSANLQKFGSRLETFLKSGLEYGTASNLIFSLAKEARDTAELHSNVAADLLNPVQAGIKNWQKENFHKSSISTSLKESKSFDSEFESAQKTWYKCYKQVNKCKKDYFHACKVVRSLQVQVQNAKSEPFGTPEQHQRAKELRRMEDKLKKATTEEEKTRKAYQDAISALNDVTPRYMDDMTQVFNKAQAFERKRIEHFKQQVFAMQEVLDISSKSNLPNIFAEMKNTISKVDVDADLKKWSLMYGVDTPTNFPTFQEYSPELCALGKKGKSAVADGGSAITLTSMKSLSSPDRQTNPGVPDIGFTANDYNTGENNDHGIDSMSMRSNCNGTDFTEVQFTNLDSPTATEIPAHSPEPLTSDIEKVECKAEERLIAPTKVENRPQEAVHYLDDAAPSTAAVVRRLRSPSSIVSEEDPEATNEKTPNNDGYNSTLNGGSMSGVVQQPSNSTENVTPYPDLVDDGRPGVPIRALYDYVGVESDELSFHQGDLFEKLEDEDEQGWCKGRKDGRVGLYPANYVQLV